MQDIIEFSDPHRGTHFRRYVTERLKDDTLSPERTQVLEFALIAATMTSDVNHSCPRCDGDEAS